MSAVLSDYFLNIDTRADEQAAQDAAFEAWLECQDLGSLLDADDLLMLANTGHDIRNQVQTLVQAKYNEEVEAARRDDAFERAYANW